MLILGVGDRAEVRTSVVPTVTITVIDALARAYTHDEPVHELLSTAGHMGVSVPSLPDSDSTPLVLGVFGTAGYVFLFRGWKSGQ